MILVDTSAWVEYDRATGSTADQRLVELIAAEGSIAVTEPVMMEVMADARNDTQEKDLRRLLLRFELLRFDATTTDFVAATRIYRHCGRGGVTPRGMIDCMIAAVAWRHGVALLSWDMDLDRVAQVAGIQLDGHSLRS